MVTSSGVLALASSLDDLFEFLVVPVWFKNFADTQAALTDASIGFKIRETPQPTGCLFARLVRVPPSGKIPLLSTTPQHKLKLSTPSS